MKVEFCYVFCHYLVLLLEFRIVILCVLVWLQSELLFSILKFRYGLLYFTFLFVHNLLLVDVFLDFFQLRKITKI